MHLSIINDKKYLDIRILHNNSLWKLFRYLVEDVVVPEEMSDEIKQKIKENCSFQTTLSDI